MDEKFELACFQIITYVGTARTHFINAIQCAKEGKYDEAEELIKQGDEAFSLGHNAHADYFLSIFLYSAMNSSARMRNPSALIS